MFNSSPFSTPSMTPNKLSPNTSFTLSNSSSNHSINSSTSQQTQYTPLSSPSKSNTWKSIASPDRQLISIDYSSEDWTIIPDYLPLYHPYSSSCGKNGYYPNLTQQQIAAVSLLKKKCIENKIDLYDENEHEYFRLLRFLRARKFDVDAAYILLNRDIEWRIYKVGLDLRYEAAENVLNCDLKRVMKYYPAFISGVDKQYRPVCYRSFGNFRIWKLLEITTFEKLIRFHAWESEQALLINSKQTSITGYNIDTFVVVVDAKGFSLSLATSDAFSFIKSMSEVDSNHYPERLGCCLVINAPVMLSFVWSIVETFLDSVTKAKIKIMSSESEWKPVLFSMIERNQIPMMYGGTVPNPDVENPFKQHSEVIKTELRRPIAKPVVIQETVICEVKNENGEHFFSSFLGEHFWWLDLPVSLTYNLFTAASFDSNRPDSNRPDSNSENII